MIGLKDIVVATDFGEASDAALRYGRALARAFGATLHVLHVTDNVIARVGTEMCAVDVSELQQEIEASARRRLDALLSDQDRLDLRARAVLRVSRSPAYDIVDYAKENRIGLIVLGTHGRGGVERLLLGSVAERVVRIAPCPVLTVRSPEHDFVTPDALVAAAKS